MKGGRAGLAAHILLKHLKSVKEKGGSARAVLAVCGKKFAERRCQPSVVGTPLEAARNGLDGV